MDLIVVAGLRRSGNHAIINWLTRFYRYTVFHNNLPDFSEGALWDRPRKTFAYWSGRPGRLMTYKEQFQARGLGPSCRILSLEDKSIEEVIELWNQRWKIQHHENDRLILVLRSFWNMLASRMNKSDTPKNYNDRIDERWLEYAEFQGPNIVNYDQWYTTPGYRRELETALDLPSPKCPEDMDYVPDFGGGSSYSGTRLPGKDLNVLGRWKGENFPVSYLRNRRLEEAQLKHFGWTLNYDGTGLRNL